jgi:hypothetical protein
MVIVHCYCLPLLVLLSTISAAECNPPSNLGMRICSPTTNSTVAYIPMIEFNSTSAPGRQITQYIVDDNDRKIVQALPDNRQIACTIFNFLMA